MLWMLTDIQGCLEGVIIVVDMVILQRTVGIGVGKHSIQYQNLTRRIRARFKSRKELVISWLYSHKWFSVLRKIDNDMSLSSNYKEKRDDQTSKRNMDENKARKVRHT